MLILLVDDEPQFKSLVEKFLQSKYNDLSVVSVATCKDAMAQLTNGEYDLVMLDYGLANEDGLECLKIIRSILPNIPIVMVTGFDSCDLMNQCMQAGADDYVRKDLISTLLVHVVWSAIQRRKATSKIKLDVV